MAWETFLFIMIATLFKEVSFVPEYIKMLLFLDIKYPNPSLWVSDKPVTIAYFLLDDSKFAANVPGSYIFTMTCVYSQRQYLCHAWFPALTSPFVNFTPRAFYYE